MKTREQAAEEYYRDNQVKSDMSLHPINSFLAGCEFEAQNRWIPVSERLPEDDGIQVLVALSFTYFDPDVTTAIFHGGFFHNLEDKTHKFRNVTHWSSLPSPPKPQEL
jgi:hypothetical protein